MEITALEKLEIIGISNAYFSMTTVGKLPTSCCLLSNIEVIDFDKTKDKVTKNFQLISLKSCDALKIIKQENRIDFIETKGIKNFIKYQINPVLSNEKLVETKSKEQIKDFNFARKITDSKYIIDTIFLSKFVEPNNYQREMYDNITINYIILTDHSTRHFF